MHTDLSQLKAYLQQAKLDISIESQQKMMVYLQMIEKWDKTHNLTAICGIDQMITHHLMDSLMVLQYLPEGPLLDVGTGAGLPGIPLAIARPEREFILLDSRFKRIAFLQQVIGKLGLDNVKLHHGRVEDFQRDKKELFEGVISRAFSSLKEFIKLTKHLCQANGFFYAMKGQFEKCIEGKGLPDGYEIDKILPLRVPGLNKKRCLIIVAKRKAVII